MMMPPRPPVTPLHQDQVKAATAPVGPVLILGGAGSGMTHTIAARIAVWLKGGADPLQIACLTHSAGGGGDIRRRVREFLPDEDPFLGIYTGTPQQLALYLLRFGGMEVLGRSADFTVWQHDEAQAVIAELLAGKGRKRGRADSEAGRVLDWHRLNRARFAGEGAPPISADWPDLVAVYQEEKERQNVVDYGDLVTLVTLALERDRAFREGLAWSTCHHLLIDGLQDLAPAEYGMARLLTGPERSITAAANPNAFVRTGAGADYSVLKTFLADYFPEPGRGKYLLNLAHRSTAAIGGVVNRISRDPAMGHLIEEQNRYFRTNRRVGRTVLSEIPPALLVFEGQPADMYRYIVDRSEEFVAQGYALEDIACIYQDASILDHLRLLAVSRGLPYTVLGSGPRAWDRDARRITGLLASLLNPHDVAAFRIAASPDPRLEPPWLDPMAAVRVAGMARDLGADLVQAAGRYCRNPLIDAGLRRGLEWFVDAWQNLDRMLGEPFTGVHDICRRAVFLLEEEQGPAHPLRSKYQVQRLLVLAGREPVLSDPQPGPQEAREALREFLDTIHPEINADPLAAENTDPASPTRGLTLTTVAAAQGLEWPVVWAVGASDHILPGDVPATDQRRMRAAQHLFYVWSTRARDLLVYCHATRSGPERDARPTRFLEPVGGLITHEAVPPPNPRR